MEIKNNSHLLRKFYVTGLATLLDQSDDSVKAHSGVYINNMDWRPCSNGTHYYSIIMNINHFHLYPPFPLLHISYICSLISKKTLQYYFYWQNKNNRFFILSILIVFSLRPLFFSYIPYLNSFKPSLHCFIYIFTIRIRNSSRRWPTFLGCQTNGKIFGEECAM